MELTKEAIRIAQEAHDKTLFEAALDCISAEEMFELAGEKPFKQKTKTIEEIQEILSLVDERDLEEAEFFMEKYNISYNDEILDKEDILMLLDEEMDVLNAEFFGSSNKEARRRTRRANRSYKISKEERKREEEIRDNRLYNGLYTPLHNVKKSVSNQRRAADAKCIKDSLKLMRLDAEAEKREIEYFNNHYDEILANMDMHVEAMSWWRCNCERYTSSINSICPFVVRSATGEIIGFFKTKEKAEAFIQSFSIEEV